MGLSAGIRSPKEIIDDGGSSLLLKAMVIVPGTIVRVIGNKLEWSHFEEEFTLCPNCSSNEIMCNVDDENLCECNACGHNWKEE